MEITTKTSAADFAAAVSQGTGISLDMAESLESLKSSTMRTKPMPFGVATAISEYVKQNFDAGEGVSDVRVSVSAVGWSPAWEEGNDNTNKPARLIIQSDMEDSAYGNIARFTRGEKPGLSFGGILNAAPAIMKSHYTKDENDFIFQKDHDDPETQAILGYLKEIATHSSRKMEWNENGDIITVTAPRAPVQMNDPNIGHAYSALHDLLHRDMAIPLESGDRFMLNRDVVMIGAERLGFSTEKPNAIIGSISQAISEHVEKNGLQSILKAPADQVAHVLLIDAYVSSIRDKYPDVRSSLLKEVCYLSRTSGAMLSAEAIVNTLPERRFPQAQVSAPAVAPAPAQSPTPSPVSRSPSPS